MVTSPTPQSSPPALSIVIVEDSPDDAALIAASLRRGGFECRATRVETEADLIAALTADDPVAVITDHNLPRFSGAEAIAVVRRHCPDVPVIVVSGALGEEAAVEMLKLGAVDYIMKERLERLAPALQRAVEESRAAVEKRRLDQLIAGVTTGMVEV